MAHITISVFLMGVEIIGITFHGIAFDGIQHGTFIAVQCSQPKLIIPLDRQKPLVHGRIPQQPFFQLDQVLQFFIDSFHGLCPIGDFQFVLFTDDPAYGFMKIGAVDGFHSTMFRLMDSFSCSMCSMVSFWLPDGNSQTMQSPLAYPITADPMGVNMDMQSFLTSLFLGSTNLNFLCHAKRII